MTQETYNRLFRAVIKEGAKGNLTIEEIGVMGGVFMAMAQNLPKFVAMVHDYEHNQEAAKGKESERCLSSRSGRSQVMRSVAPPRKSLNKSKKEGEDK